MKTDRELIALARAGDKDAENELMLRHIRLVHYAASKHDWTPFDYDERFSLAQWAMFLAYQNYDLQESAKFSTFAYTYMKNEIRSALEHAQRKKRNAPLVSIQKPIARYKRGIELLLQDILVADYDVLAEVEYTLLVKEIQDLLYSLGNRARVMARLHFFEGKNQTEISELMHCTKQAVNQSLMRTREKLRAALYFDETI